MSDRGAEFEQAPIQSYENKQAKSNVLSKSKVRRAKILGIVMLLLAGFVMFVLAPASQGIATFGLSFPDDKFQLDALAIPSTAALYVLATVLAFMGGTQFLKGFQRKSTMILGISFVVFVISIMIWATAGQEFSLVSMLVSTIARTTPCLGALSESCVSALCRQHWYEDRCSRGFHRVVMGSLLGGWVGLIAATITGGILALLLAFLSINYRVDQIIIGVVINLLVLGLTSFLTAQVLVGRPEWNDAPIFPAIKIPSVGRYPGHWSDVF